MLTRKDLESLWCRATTLDDTTTPIPTAIFQELFDYGGITLPSDTGDSVSVDDAVEALDQLTADLDAFKASIAGWVAA